MASAKSKLALHGGSPVHPGPWPAWPVHDESEREALLRVLESGQWWYGERVREFEERFAAFQDARFGVTCTSGTAALELALLAAGVGIGHEVIVPPYTFIATATAVLKVNAVPVFVDIDPETLNLDPTRIEAAITPRTAAILPVHFAGLPADMDAINALARRRGLRVIEDAAHAWGSKWHGKGCGALGHAGTFSFQASKNITAGEGGIVLTDDAALARNARALSNVGRGAEERDLAYRLPCGNARMTEFQAALLLAQLTRLAEQTARRQANAALLNEGLAAIEGIRPLREDPRANPRSYHLYIFRFDPDRFGCTRERFLEALQAEGVPCHGGYPHPIYRQPVFSRSHAPRGNGALGCSAPFSEPQTGQEQRPHPWPYYGLTVDYSGVCCPHAERACREVVWLKQSMLLGSEQDMRDIVAAVGKIRDGVGCLK